MDQDSKDEDKKGKTIIEEIEVAGSQLVDKVKDLVRQGNVRQLKLWVEGGDFTLELPMTVGVIAGGALVLTAPWLAVLGVIAALVTKVKIEVERDEDAPATPPATEDDDVTLTPPPAP